MDFKKIQELNKNLKYTPIKGKNYIQVNQRVLAFRELFPNGRITTEIVKLSSEGGTTVIVKASIYDGDALISTGHAFENTGKNKNINTFSALENCETSAVGRALGFVGIGATDSIASYEEIAPTIEDPNNYAQKLAGAVPDAEPPKLITPEHKAAIERLYKGDNMTRLLDHYQIESIDQLEDKTASGLLATIAAKQKAKKGANNE